MIGKLIVSLFFIPTICLCQSLIKSDDLKHVDGLILIEFWEKWNAPNECKWLSKIDGVECFRMGLSSKLAKKLEIKVLPTLVLWENDEIIETWEGDITFQLPKGTQKKVQSKVDELNISKF